ncbi:hypothetical protein ACJMK2_010247 [Sinanodonta woodiana]|uniref:Dehydrogenase/reductase SDR family member 4 n=1 Tax=Sinanodonta woodiana TaxID=1069815 RepID=A0ABD3VER7_SINWO
MNGKQKFAGKVAIVTGSTTGIGLSIAKRLAREGASVMINSRKQEHVDEALRQMKAESLNVSGIPGHISDAEHRKKMIQKTLVDFGGIDILVSTVAVNPVFGKPLLDIPESAWDKIFEVNLKANFLLCKEIVPHIETRGGGAVVFISSVSAYLLLEPLTVYAISKIGLVALARALVHQLSPKNIRVNCVSPGIVKTHFGGKLWQSKSVAEENVKTVPMKRFAEPEEIAAAVSFLVSDDASYITGENLVVSGGMTARL